MSGSEVFKIQNENFKKAIGVSVGAHSLILILFLLNLIFVKSPPLDLSQAIRVDMVGLPDKIEPGRLPEKIQDVATPAPKVEPKAKVEKLPEKIKPAPVVKESVIDLKKTKTKQKEALEKLKKTSAIDKIKQDLKNEDQQKKIHEEATKTILKGRVVSAGTALTGLDKLDANAYLQDVDQQIKQHWTLPQWLLNKPFKARVHVKFDASGQIISRTLMQSSGEPSYDSYCLQAVDQAAPFPKVPEKFTEKFSVDGVVIGFPE